MRIVVSFIFMLMCFVSSYAGKHTYSAQSVLASGTWAKIRITETGVCRISYQELKSMGFSDPSKVGVFGYGGALLDENFANPKIDDLPELDVYDNGSALYFYVQGTAKWFKRNSSATPYVCEFNHYSDAGYYFLSDSGSAKRLKVNGTYEKKGDVLTSEYLYTDVIHKDEFNFVRSGRVWYSDILHKGDSKNYSFNVPNIVKDREMKISVSCAAAASSRTRMNVTCGEITESCSFASASDHLIATEASALIETQPTSNQVRLTLNYLGSNTSDYAALNRIVINAYAELRMNGDYLLFRNPDYEAYEEDKFVTFSLKNAKSSTQIWNVTDPMNVKLEPVHFAGDSLLFCVNHRDVQEFAAVNPDGNNFVSAEYVGRVKNQNLHGLKDVAFVIISHPDFLEQAERLAEKHRQVDDVNVAVVTPEEVYNEFSSGTPDATAYRWLMKMLYDREGGRKYLLLFGDGCYDNKGILATKANPSTAFILTFQSRTAIDETTSFTTDDYFGFLDDTEGGPGDYAYANAKLDIGVGRLPVSTEKQAKGVVDKIISYMNNAYYGPWKNKICLVADDNELSSSVNKFFNYSETIESIIYKKNPSMEVKKLYFDAYLRDVGSNGARYPELQKELADAIDEGFVYLNYVGHSSKTTWSAEKVFGQSQAASLHNKKLGFWFTASCEFSQFDDLTPAGGEDLVLNPDGGAIAIYSSTRVVYDDKNDRLNRALAPYLFDRDEDGRPYRLGDMVRLSKQNIPNDSNKLAYVFLGDPMLRLNYPDLLVSTDSVQNYDGEPTDTMRALASVKIFGSIVDEEGNKVTSFNGRTHVLVFDKQQTLYTRANLYSTEQEILDNRFPYTARPNLLYSGTADVVDGEFSILFRVPKDINYSYGTGRISYYAYDEENAFEAQGSYEDFYVGGSDTTTIVDEQGPEVTLYLNRELVEKSITVHETPTFYAYVEDASGINATGSGIGHDITLTLNDSKSATILNSNFSYDVGSDHSGYVKYQMPELEEGHYTLTFKVWDLLNNSTTRQIEFDVVKGLRINMEELTLYPNPVQEKLTVRVSHNRPSEQISYRMMVFDLSGREVYSSGTKTDVNDGMLEFEWDLRTTNGARLREGAYVCKVGVSSSSAGYAEKSQNLLVLPQ